MFKITGTEVSRHAFCSKILFKAYAVPHCANHLVIFCLERMWLYQLMHFVIKLILGLKIILHLLLLSSVCSAYSTGIMM